MKQLLTFLVLLIALSSQAQLKLTIKSSSGSFTGSTTQTAFPSQKRIFDVKNYGAKCDGKYTFDAQATNGSTTLTDSLANFTAADVGKVFELYKTYNDTLLIHGTITAYISPVQVTLSTAATATCTVGRFFYGTDDTHALQTVIDTADIAGGGKIIGDGICAIAGALQTTNPRFPGIPYNNQLMLPYYAAGNATDDKQYKTIAFEGTFAPPSGYLWTIPPPQSGWILKSCIYATTGSRPCLIGGPDDQLDPNYGHWYETGIRCNFKNMVFRGQAKPNLMLVDLGTVATGDIKECAIDADNQIQNATEPTDTRAVGLRMPMEGALVICKAEEIWISGQYIGMIPGETTQVDYAFIYGCEWEGQFWKEYYPPVFGYMVGSWNRNGWRWLANAHIEMPFYHTEHKGASNPGVTWQQRQYDFYEDAAGMASGHIKFYEVLGGAGEEHNLLTNIAASSPVIFQAYSAVPKITSCTDGSIPGTGVWTDVPSSYFTIDQSGDYSIDASGLLKFSGTTGAVSVSLQVVYGGSYVNLPSSEKVIYEDGNIVSDKTIRFNTSVQARFIAKKTTPTGAKLQIKATYTGGTLTVVGTTTPGGTTITRKPL